MRDEDREEWFGGPRNLGEGGIGPWLIAIGVVVGVWLVLSVIATLADAEPGFTFLLL